jgi:hypothetical protein
MAVSLLIAGVVAATFATADDCRSVAVERANTTAARGSPEGVYVVTRVADVWTVTRQATGATVVTVECR